MATAREKQLAILLLKERLERKTGKKVVLKEFVTNSSEVNRPSVTLQEDEETPESLYATYVAEDMGDYHLEDEQILEVLDRRYEEAIKEYPSFNIKLWKKELLLNNFPKVEKQYIRSWQPETLLQEDILDDELNEFSSKVKQLKNNLLRTGFTPEQINAALDRIK